MFRGKFAEVREGTVVLYAEAAVDGDGDLRGCGDTALFPETEVDILAHRRDVEVREYP